MADLVAKGAVRVSSTSLSGMNEDGRSTIDPAARRALTGNRAFAKVIGTMWITSSTRSPAALPANSSRQTRAPRFRR